MRYFDLQTPLYIPFFFAENRPDPLKQKHTIDQASPNIGGEIELNAESSSCCLKPKHPSDQAPPSAVSVLSTSNPLKQRRHMYPSRQPSIVCIVANKA